MKFPMKKSVSKASANLRDLLLAKEKETEKPAKAFSIEPTASQTDRFLGCAWPWGKQATDFGVGDAGRFGSAVHAVLEETLKKKQKRIAQKTAKTAAKKYGVDEASVFDRASAALMALQAFLKPDGNPWQIDFTSGKFFYEIAFAYDIVSGTARRCALPNQDHVYADRKENEITGTADLVVVGGGWLLVLDYKTGFDTDPPSESGQLKTLALAAQHVFGVDMRALVAILHASERMAPTVYGDSLDVDDLNLHRGALSDANRNRKREKRSLAPDYYCKYCQLRSGCPVNQGALVELRLGKDRLATAEDVGAAHLKLQEMSKRFKELSLLVDAEIRAWIRKNGDAIRPDGREVGFVEREYTSLSQASVLRKLGPVKGGKLLEELRKGGVIETGTRLELRVK